MSKPARKEARVAVARPNARRAARATTQGIDSSKPIDEVIDQVAVIASPLLALEAG